jgi:general secretion pathway protein I
VQSAKCKVQNEKCVLVKTPWSCAMRLAFYPLHFALCTLHSASSLRRVLVAHAVCGSVAEPPARRRRPGRRGFSLLEVILAIAILTGAIAVLGEVARQGIESTRVARDTSRALLLCENKLAEITSGLVYPDTMYDVPCDNMADVGLPVVEGVEPLWVYSVEVASVDLPGLVAVRVSVYQNLPPESEPVECSLVRWIVDPGVEFYVPEEDTSGTGSTQGGASSGGAAGTTGGS